MPFLLDRQIAALATAFRAAIAPPAPRVAAEEKAPAKAKGNPAGAGSHWITVHPNGPDEKGQPILIGGDGKVLGGMGGKFNGTRVSDLGKVGAHKGKSAPPAEGHKAPASSTPAEAPAQQPAHESEHEVHPHYNEHLKHFQGLHDVADVRVKGVPVRNSDKTWSMSLANAPASLLKKVHAAGGGLKMDNGSLLGIDDNGHLRYHTPRQPEGKEHAYHEAARLMGEHVMTHVLSDADDENTQGDSEYAAVKDHEADQFRRGHDKQVRDYIREEGGIAAPKHFRDMKGDPRKADEYRYLPAHFKRNEPGSKTIDEMYHLVAARHPELALDSENDFRDYLMAHGDRMKADSAKDEQARGDRKRQSDQEHAARAAAQEQAKAEADKKAADEKRQADLTAKLAPAPPSSADVPPSVAQDHHIDMKLHINRLVRDLRKHGGNPRTHASISEDIEAARIAYRDEFGKEYTPTKGDITPMLTSTNPAKAAQPHPLPPLPSKTPAPANQPAPSPAPAPKFNPWLAPAVGSTADKAQQAARAQAERQDYKGGHLRFDRSTWAQFAVDHPASIAAYNAAHPDGYNPATHHVVHELTGLEKNKFLPPKLRAKGDVEQNSRYVERSAYTPAQHAAMDELKALTPAAPQGNMDALFAGMGPKYKTPEPVALPTSGPSAGDVALFARQHSESTRRQQVNYREWLRLKRGSEYAAYRVAHPWGEQQRRSA